MLRAGRADPRADGLATSSPTSATRRATRSATSTSAPRRRRDVLGWRPLFTLDEGLRSGRSPGTRDFLSAEERAHEPHRPPAARAAATRSSRSSSLGATPLANALLDAPTSSTSPSRRYPLDLVFCPACSLVQITETVPPEELFRDYVYFSSFSDTMLAHAARARARLIARARLGARQPRRRGRQQRRLPAAVLPASRRAGARHRAGAQHRARWREERRHPDARASSSARELAARLAARGHARRRHPRATTCSPTSPDLNGFVAGIRDAAEADDGVAVIEVPYVKDMLDHCEFDTIYHEHLCYFSLTALDAPASAGTGWRIADVERVPIHGGSLRLFAAPTEAATSRPRRSRRCSTEERGWGVATLGAVPRVRASACGSSSASCATLLGATEGGRQADRRLRRRRPRAARC